MSPFSYQIWLRRINQFNPSPTGAWRDLELPAIGNAAARETLVTATPHMATIWTDLFKSIIAPGSKLKWRGDGPGIGRDARIAYSSLLGRYMARAYLTEHEKVQVLVPLDVAKRRLKGTLYGIGKDPPSRGLEADWIGLDDCGLVIVEAKGTFNNGVRTWRGPYSRPQILQTAVKQAERTAVFQRYSGQQLPAKRWAIASRWGTEENHRESTLLVWDSGEDKIGKDDYQLLAKTLIRADLGGVLRGLGHLEAAIKLGVVEPSEHDRLGLSQSLDNFRARDSDVEPSDRVPGDIWIRVGEHLLEPGFAATVGLFGMRPLRDQNDIQQVRAALELNLNVVVASLSSRYATIASHDQRWTEVLEVAPTQYITLARREQRVTEAAKATNDRTSIRTALTVVWLNEGEDVAIAEE